MSKSKFNFQDDMFEGVTVGEESISRGWDDFYTRHSTFEAAEDAKSENPNRTMLERVQRQLARTANVVKNATVDEGEDQGVERTLMIEFTNGDKGKVNKPTSNVIYLNPDKFLNRPAGKDELSLIEADMGKTLVVQAMKATCSKASWNKAKAAANPADSRARATNALWEATETAVARLEVLKDWPGFLPYFLRHAQETGATHDQVQSFIDASPEKPTAEVCSTAIAWNLLNPNNKVKLPPIYNRASVEASKLVIKAGGARTKRYDLCAEALVKMQELLDEDWSAVPPPPPPPGPGEEDESGDKDDECKGKKPSEGEGKGEGKGKGEGEGKGEDESESEEKDGTHDSSSGEGEGEGEPAPEPPPASKSPTSSEDEADDEDDGKDPGKAKPGGGVGAELSAPKLVDDELFGGESPTAAKKEDLPEPMGIDDVDKEPEVELPRGIERPKGVVVSTYETNNSADYMKQVAAMRPAINAIIGALRFRNNDATQFSRGQSSGDLDDGALHRLTMREENPTIWERREVVSSPSIAVCLLVDESGSMGTGHRYEKARSVAVAMTEALKQIKGVNLMVLGHTANCHAGARGGMKPRRCTVDNAVKLNTSDQCGDLIISEYLTRQHRNSFAVACISANANNLDGFAMEYAAQRVATDYPACKAKVVFVISDGQPSGTCGRHGYGGREANQHMSQVCATARNTLGVNIYGIGIDSAYSQKTADSMYGPGRGVVIKDVAGSIPILTSFLRQIANQV